LPLTVFQPDNSDVSVEGPNKDYESGNTLDAIEVYWIKIISAGVEADEAVWCRKECCWICSTLHSNWFCAFLVVTEIISNKPFLSGFSLSQKASSGSICTGVHLVMLASLSTGYLSSHPFFQFEKSRLFSAALWLEIGSFVVREPGG
jgi:hypothetical protein